MSFLGKYSSQPYAEMELKQLWHSDVFNNHLNFQRLQEEPLNFLLELAT